MWKGIIILIFIKCNQNLFAYFPLFYLLIIPSYNQSIDLINFPIIILDSNILEAKVKINHSEL